VQRGEATAEVTATGVRTKFGRTAELVGTAHVVSSQQKAVLRIVRTLAFFNGAVIILIGVYAYVHSMPWSEIVPLLLTSVLAAIPVALPATFTLAAAVGARSLAKIGVLPTRLTAVDEAATIDVLCSDKTGTLTRNELSVTSVRPMPGFDEGHVLGLAALANSDGGQDSVDAAIRAVASHKPVSGLPRLTNFVPFDPGKKISEATATDVQGAQERIVKGAFTAVTGLAGPAPTAAAIADELEKKGLQGTGGSRGCPGIDANDWLYSAQ
jgi:H+-transporting ATPase